MTREDLEAVLGAQAVLGARSRFPATSHVRVPGQHPSHYAPRAQVVLV
ncbi:Sua5 family C-terminal domain-containing protein [Streptomyces sp. IBSBF 3136]